MNPLIDYIKTALTQADSIESALKFLPISFKKDFPVAYIHSQTRIKNAQTKKALESLLDENGLTPTHPNQEEFSLMRKNAPALLQSVSYLCLKKEPAETISYAPKNPNDYWKKIQDIEHINAVFDIAHPTDEEVCEAEFTLREVIRKRKEVHALKGLGYILLIDSSKDISKVFDHYFGKHYSCINDRYYLGWTKALKDINMRYFVCQPPSN